jgi:hypothetical protein
MRRSWDLSLLSSHFNLSWNFYLSTIQVFSAFKSTETERADSASVIMLWFFLVFQKRTSSFSSLLICLFLVFCISLSAWCSKSWCALMSLYLAHKSSQRRESLTFFFYIEMLSVLSCLTVIESQWSFELWSALCVI